MPQQCSQRSLLCTVIELNTYQISSCDWPNPANHNLNHNRPITTLSRLSEREGGMSSQIVLVLRVPLTTNLQNNITAFFANII